MRRRSGRILLAAGAAVSALAWAAGAAAQVDPGLLRERQAARMEADSLRQDQLAAARRAQAARDRADAAATLRATQPPAAPGSLQPGPPQVLPERGDPAAALSLRLDELDRLTDARLARSNAAIRAVKPASER